MEPTCSAVRTAHLCLTIATSTILLSDYSRFYRPLIERPEPSNRTEGVCVVPWLAYREAVWMTGLSSTKEPTTAGIEPYPNDLRVPVCILLSQPPPWALIIAIFAYLHSFYHLNLVQRKRWRYHDLTLLGAATVTTAGAILNGSDWMSIVLIWLPFSLVGGLLLSFVFSRIWKPQKKDTSCEESDDCGYKSKGKRYRIFSVTSHCTCRSESDKCLPTV